MLRKCIKTQVTRCLGTSMPQYQCTTITPLHSHLRLLPNFVLVPEAPLASARLAAVNRYSICQSMGAMPASVRSLFVLEKCLQPKKPLFALSPLHIMRDTQLCWCVADAREVSTHAFSDRHTR